MKDRDTKFQHVSKELDRPSSTWNLKEVGGLAGYKLLNTTLSKIIHLCCYNNVYGVKFNSDSIAGV